MSDFNTTLTSIRSGIECFNRIKDSASNRHRSVCNELSDLERSISEKLTNFEARLDTIYMEMNSLRENQNEDNQSQTTQNINRLQAEAEQIRQKAAQLESLKSRCEMLSERYYSSASALMSSITTNATDGVSLMNAYMRKIEGIEGYASGNSHGNFGLSNPPSVSSISESPLNSTRDTALNSARENSLSALDEWTSVGDGDSSAETTNQENNSFFGRIIAFFRHSSNEGVESHNSGVTQDCQWHGLRTAPDPYGSGWIFLPGNHFSQYCDTISDYEAHPRISYSPDQQDFRMVDPADIEGVYLGDTEAENSSMFWRMHNGSQDAWLETASHIPEVQMRLESGDSLNLLLQDPRLGRCAQAYFNPNSSKAIKVDEMSGGGYLFGGDGRHRIIAARLCGHHIPVLIEGRRR